jgi:hypothetical protein
VNIRQQKLEEGKHEVNMGGEFTDVKNLIYTKDLYDNEGDYLFYFLMSMIESCCVCKGLPLIVIRNTWFHLKSLIDEENIKVSHAHKQFTAERLDKIRAEIVNEFYKHLQLDAFVSHDYFEKMTQLHLDKFRFADATYLIVNFDLHKKFDLLDLSIQLCQIKRIDLVKLLLDKVATIRYEVIKRLSTNENAKMAVKLIKNYQLPH